ncbi:MAG: nucleotidyl transferase AbiEii/AbiGii toxin family protein [Thermoproteales archaeon]|nr:nucleotidyl transferase AbiEii/AbiGii toxin family protein [Thermoproteales archaeon]
MILRDELFRISKLYRLTPFQAEKIYIQMHILNSIFSRTYNELVFKGGTAMMLCYQLPRFSEDLDFTLINYTDFRKLPLFVKKDLELYGILSNIKILKDTSIAFSFRIGAEGPLFANEIERCYVRVEISMREKVILKPSIKNIFPLFSDLMPFSVYVMDKKEILAEKIRAFLTRLSARDLFDIWYMINKKDVEIDQELIQRKLKYYNKEFSVRDLEKRMIPLKDIWISELEPILLINVPSFEKVRKDVLSRFR